MTDGTPRETVWDRMAGRRESRGERFRIEPDQLWRAALGVPLGAAYGFVAFWIGSSRGLDAYEIALVGAGLIVIAGVIATIVGLFRGWFEDRWTLLLALPAVAMGLAIGGQLALRAIPGDTTDGSMVWLPADPLADRSDGGSVCTWVDGRVARVDSRRTLGYGVDPFGDRFGLDLATAMLSIDQINPQTGTSMLHRSFEALGVAPDEASAHVGSATFAFGTLRWDCPALP